MSPTTTTRTRTRRVRQKRQSVLGWSVRLVGVPALLLLAGWGVCLGAWVSTVATLLLAAVVLFGRRLRAGCLGLLLGSAVFAAGLVEVPLATHRLGVTARSGSLAPSEQAAVAGINVLLAACATLLGFSDFGWETAALLAPVSLDGDCPADRLRRYPISGAAPLRSWSSDLPLRSERFRAVVREWAEALPVDAEDGGERRLGPAGPFTWGSAAYLAADEANRVPVALNAPTTTMEGVAVRVDGRWRLDLVVHLFVAYPERATFHVGPLTLEEGLFHDAPLFVHPYCGEYRFERYADDPSLQRTTPIRGPFERVSTGLLRAVGAGYR